MINKGRPKKIRKLNSEMQLSLKQLTKSVLSCQKSSKAQRDSFCYLYKARRINLIIMSYNKYREEIKYYLKEHRNILTNGDLDDKILQIMQIEYLNLITEKLDKILGAIEKSK